MPVGVAGSSAGSLTISGKLDTTNTDKGFARLKQNFAGVKGFTKGFQADLKRMTLSAARLAKTLVGLGLVGAGALVNLAKSAPAVAPALAKMRLAMFKLSNALGRALAPAFEKVVGWLNILAGWVAANEGRIGNIALRFLEWAEAVGVKLWPALKLVGQFILDHPKLFATFVAGLILGPKILAGIATIKGFVTFITGGTILAGMGAAALKLGAIALAFTAVALAVQNKEDIKAVGDVFKPLGQSTGVGDFFSRLSDINAGFGEARREASPGGFFQDLFETTKAGFSPLAQLFGADPYIPKGWRGTGTPWVIREENRRQQLRDFEDTIYS